MFKKTINILVLVTSVIAALFLIEVLLRFFYPYPYFGPDDRYFYRADPEAGYDISENFGPCWHVIKGYRHKIWSNALGCFDQPYQGEKDYILLVGDSFVFGYVPYKYMYGRRIEDYLGYRVLKCGVLGYGTKQELIKTKKIIDETGNFPKLIILGYFFNDHIDDFLFPCSTVKDGYLSGTIANDIDLNTGKRKFPSEEVAVEAQKYCWPNASIQIREDIKSWLRHHSLLYNILKEKKIIRLIGEKLGLTLNPLPLPQNLMFLSVEKYPWLKEVWNANLNNLKKFREFAANNGMKLLVVLIPAKEQVYDFLRPEGDYDWDTPIKILNDFLKEEGINYLDLNTYFKKYVHQKTNKRQDLYLKNEWHWNKKSDELAGLLTARYILEHNLIEIPDRDKRIAFIEEDLQRFNLD